MIVSFADKKTASIWNREHVRGIAPELQRQVRKKLLMLDAVMDVEELRSPPGNRLEKLIGDRQGSYSIRINQQWRLCFAYENGKASDVELVDYH
jgi:toxin HigB-1